MWTVNLSVANHKRGDLRGKKVRQKEERLTKIEEGRGLRKKELISIKSAEKKHDAVEGGKVVKRDQGPNGTKKSFLITQSGGTVRLIGGVPRGNESTSRRRIQYVSRSRAAKSGKNRRYKPGGKIIFCFKLSGG